MLTIGIDPGLTGALALIGGGSLLELADIPTCANGQSTGKMLRHVDDQALYCLLRDWAQRHRFCERAVQSFIERPIAMPTLPAQTVASQFDTFGVLRALLGRRGPVHIVEPREWKKPYGLSSDKDASRACALRLYPNASVHRAKDHNRAEAVLIARYGEIKTEVAL